MGKRLPHTPNNQIRSALRRLFLRSRERATAIKREHNTCQQCGSKGSVAKGKEVQIEVHHEEGVHWEGLIRDIRLHLLPDPKHLVVLCKDCHEKETSGKN